MKQREKSEALMRKKTEEDWLREFKEAKALDDAELAGMSEEEYQSFLAEILGQYRPPSQKKIRRDCRAKLNGKRGLIMFYKPC